MYPDPISWIGSRSPIVTRSAKIKKIWKKEKKSLIRFSWTQTASKYLPEWIEIWQWLYIDSGDHLEKFTVVEHQHGPTARSMGLQCKVLVLVNHQGLSSIPSRTLNFPKPSCLKTYKIYIYLYQVNSSSWIFPEGISGITGTRIS